jgi:hypothetical protein
MHEYRESIPHWLNSLRNSSGTLSDIHGEITPQIIDNIVIDSFMSKYLCAHYVSGLQG